MSTYSQRIADLEDHLRRNTILLKENEDELLLAATPRDRAYYRREIENIRESIARYRKELDDLSMENISTIDVDRVAHTLELLESKVDAVLTSVATLRTDLLARFDESDQIIITSVVDRLAARELENTRRVLLAIDEGYVSEREMTNAIDSVHSELSRLQEQLGDLAPTELLHEAAKADEIFNDPQLSVKHKLKTGFPIIPFVLSYEGEIELGQDSNLFRLWQQITGWWKRN